MESVRLEREMFSCAVANFDCCPFFKGGLVEALLKFQDFFDSCEEVGKEVELCLAQAGQVG